MRTFLALLLAACSTDPGDGRLEQDGATGLELGADGSLLTECPACAAESVDATKALTIDLGEGWPRDLRFWAHVVGDGATATVTIQAMHRDTGEVIGEAYMDDAAVVDGRFEWAWDDMVVPGRASPYGGLPTEAIVDLRLRGCVGRLDTMCGSASSRWGNLGEWRDDAQWGMADKPCPTTCDQP